MNKKWVLVLLSVFFSIAIILGIFAIFMLIPAPSQLDEPVALVKVIEAPTSTPFLLPTFEPTSLPGSQPGNGQNNGIYIGWLCPDNWYIRRWIKYSVSTGKIKLNSIYRIRFGII